jgi:hypothetical protein
MQQSKNTFLQEYTKMRQYTGLDNRGKPKSAYFEKLKMLTDNDLFDETKNKIWLSAYANNNPRSDYHWHADACSDECKARNKSDIYQRAYDENVRAC